jgi:hypothetical protein
MLKLDLPENRYLQMKKENDALREELHSKTKLTQQEVKLILNRLLVVLNKPKLSIGYKSKKSDFVTLLSNQLLSRLSDD